MKKGILTANSLKFIALIAMTCDHIGAELFPELRFLRVIGRLAFPIFAFFIAEGCKFTKNRKKYLLNMVLLAALCQVVYFVAQGSLYQCILVTFSLSIGLIYCIDYARETQSIKGFMAVAAAFAGVYILTEILPRVFTQTNFNIDYGWWGVLLPVAVFIFDKKSYKLIAAALVLLLLSAQSSNIQVYSLISIPLLLLYNGKRGRFKMKSLFYIYYPAHLAVIHLISLLQSSL